MKSGLASILLVTTHAVSRQKLRADLHNLQLVELVREAGASKGPAGGDHEQTPVARCGRASYGAWRANTRTAVCNACGGGPSQSAGSQCPCGFAAYSGNCASVALRAAMEGVGALYCRKNYCHQRPKSRQGDCAADLGNGLKEEFRFIVWLSFRAKLCRRFYLIVHATLWFRHLESPLDSQYDPVWETRHIGEQRKFFSQFIRYAPVMLFD